MEKSPTFDLAVVGGGYAGLTTANRAAQLGLKAVVLERGTEELYPCNSRYAGGVLHVSYHDVRDPVPELAQAIVEIGEGWTKPALAAAMAGSAARAVEWLTAEGAELGPPAQSSWRKHVLAPVRPPVPQLEWKGHGSDVTLRRLQRNLLGRGGEFHRGAQAVSLIVEGGSCAGVTVEENGAQRDYRARAVVLADGGFQANPELLRKHITPAPERIKQRCAPSGIGDGLRMARQAGGDVTGLEAFYGHLLSRDAMRSDRIWPYPQIDEVAAAGIVVNAEGRRIADEGRGGVFLSNAVARQPDPLAMTAVFDEPIWQGPGRAAAIPVNPTLITAGGTLFQAETLAGLAERIGVPARALERTVAEYNAAVEQGRAAQLEPARSAGKRTPTRIAEPPFYGVPLCAGITFTMGGVVTDEHGRVLRADRTPVAGLYAAGSIMGGLCGGPVCGYTGGLMKAIVFGLLAAEHIAQGAR
jgi:fumarate reductase flavoprotein subunit